MTQLFLNFNLQMKSRNYEKVEKVSDYYYTDYVYTTKNNNKLFLREDYIFFSLL